MTISKKPGIVMNPVTRSDDGIFQMLDLSRPRNSAFGASLGVHIVLIAMLLAVPLAFTDTLTIRHRVLLITPPAEQSPPVMTTHWKPPVRVSKDVRPQPLETPSRSTALPVSETIPVPVPQTPKVEVTPFAALPEPEAPAPIVLTRQPDIPMAPATIAPPKLAAVTGAFSNPAPRLEGQPQTREVQTTGFGGIRENGGRTGGTRSMAGAVSLANGFDAARDSSESFRRAAPNGSVRKGGFSDVQAGVASPVVKTRDAKPADTPAEVTFKPRPEYTSEARQLRLEGDVVFRVLFARTGETRVIEMLRGLGHGLDESAMRAAEGIRFKPAMREGIPVDATAIVHIAFQLAF